MAEHSSIVGGSTAERLLHCPGSFNLLQRIPNIAELPSEYANYGSAMHAVMDKLMTLYGEGFPTGDFHMKHAAEELLGDRFYDRVLEQHHLDDSIYPAIDTLYELMNKYGNGFKVAANELLVKFPNLPGAFGTSDLLLTNKKFVLMVDWKFGQGVPVYATYKDEHGERVNAQLMFYFAGAMAELPELFGKRRFAVAIIQPRTVERLTHTVITRIEVQMFIEDMEAAMLRAMRRDAPLHAGDYCRWCPARPFCPEHTAPLFELAEFGPMLPVTQGQVVDDDGSYGEFLAKAKYLADLAADWKKQVDDQMHTFLESGGTIPGWKLKYKTKLRQWIDEDIVNNELTKLGFGQDDIWQHKLQTFAVAEKAAKRLGKKIPDHLRVAPPTDETTVVPENDPAPAVDAVAATAELQGALKRLLQDSVSGSK